MAETLDINDKKERNWVRVAYGFKFLKNGLASFIDQQIQKQHVDLKYQLENDTSNPAKNCASCSPENLLPEHKTRQCIQNSRSKCFCSSWQNRRKCPNQFCSRFYDKVVFAHSEANPSWQNTDPSRWYTDYWELAKCFLGTTGYLTIHSASETDVTGLLSIAINDLFVVNEIDNLDNFKQARLNRNEIFHRKMLHVTDDEVAMYIDRMIDVLQDKSHLLRDVECQKAVNQLNKLKQNQLYISTEDEEELKNEALATIKAVTEKSKSEIEEVKAISIKELELKALEIKEQLGDTALEIKVRLGDTALEIKEQLGDTALEIKEQLGDTALEIKEQLGDTALEIKEQLGDTALEIKEQLGDTALEIKEQLWDTAMEVKEQLGDTALEKKEQLGDTALEIKEQLGDTALEIKEQLGDTALEIKEQLGETALEIKEQLWDTALEVKEQLGDTALEVTEQLWDTALEVKEQLGDTALEIKEQLGDTALEIKEQLGDTALELREQLRDTAYTLSCQIRPAGNKNSLRLKLVRFYLDRHSTIPMSPLVAEDLVPLEEIYEQPPMTAIDLRRPFGNPSKTSVTSYKQLFFNDDGNTYKHIYVTADAGVGKTCFSKHICMTWCQATDQVTSPVKTFKPEDIAVIKYFDFLFLVTLRDVDTSKCDLDDMIIASLQTDFDCECLNRILTDRSCLIILDGLDEWTHPSTCTKPHNENDVPHSKYRTNCTILTTLRPWKLDVIRPASNQIDRHIEIDHLEEKSTKQLAINAVNLLNNRSANRPLKTAEEFLNTISLTNLGDVQRVPYIYLQCVCLWFDGKEIGNSKCKIYFSVVELTLDRGIMKIQSEEPFQVSVQAGREFIAPRCLVEKPNCMQHLSLLFKLGKLAFFSLFCEENKQRLVLGVPFVRKYLEPEELDYCLKLGLLSQNKVYGSVSQRLSNVAFQHNSLHEFFTAFYIQANLESITADSTNVREIVLKKCKSLSSVLEVSNVLIFLSGFRPQAYSEISHKIQDVVSSEEITCKYRVKTYTYPGEYIYDVLLKYQTLQVDCKREMGTSGEEYEPLPLQDILIDEDTNHEEYMSALQTIIHDNHGSLKSLSIRQCQTTAEVTQILETLDLHNIHSLDKLLFYAVARQPDLEQLLTQSMNTLRCLSLRNMNFKQGIYYDKMTVLSERCEETIFNMPLLQALCLTSLRLTHDQLNKLTAFITSRVTMTEIHMYNIVCSNHKVCRGVVLDMSQHVNLQYFGLNSVPVSQLHVNTKHLEKCMIGELSTQWFTSLQAAQHLRELWLTKLDNEAFPSLINILSALLRLEQLYIRFIDLGDRSISLSTEMTKLEYIQLYKVSMESFCLRELAKTISKLGQSVTVQLLNCTVTPEVDYQSLIRDLRKSETFTVIQDGSNAYGHSELIFQTVK